MCVERANDGAHEWNRTIDLLLTKEVLYRLSYVSMCCGAGRALQCNGGAGDGNRTRASSLEGYSSTIELLPRREPCLVAPEAGKAAGYREIREAMELVEGGGFEPPKA